jgi:RNA polymerase sigma-70 factor (ECF subfamily)
MSMTLDDRDAILAFRHGNDAVFEDVVAGYRPELLRHARRRTPDDATAEDLVQEAFVRAYLSFGRLPDDSRVRPWLHQILRNVCIDDAHRRRRELDKVDRVIAQPTAAAVGAGPEDTLGLDVDSEVLSQALADLPATHRDAFVERVVVGLEYDEIAAREGVSETNARARVSRARASLRRALQGAAAVPLAAYIALRRPGRSAYAAGSGAPTSTGVDPTAAASATRFANTIGPAVDLAGSAAPTVVHTVPMLTKAAVGIGAVATMTFATAPESASQRVEPVVVEMVTAADDTVAPAATIPPQVVVEPLPAERPDDLTAIPAELLVAPAVAVPSTTIVAGTTTVVVAPALTPTTTPVTTVPATTVPPTTVPATTVPPTTQPPETTLPPVPLTGGSVAATLVVTPSGPRLNLSGTGSISTGGSGSLSGRLGVSEPDPSGSRRLDGTVTLNLSGGTIELRLAGYGTSSEVTEPGVPPMSLNMSGVYRASGATGQLLTSGSFSGSLSGGKLSLTLSA